MQLYMRGFLVQVSVHIYTQVSVKAWTELKTQILLIGTSTTYQEDLNLKVK